MRPILVRKHPPSRARRIEPRNCSKPSRLAVCVPTFQRPRLLRLLLNDLGKQSLQPEWLIVVDGDPQSGEVRRLLQETRRAESWKLVYLRSNHANLPYQRFLGWKASPWCDCLVYLDDDLRISQTDCLEKLVEPFGWPRRHVVGVTARITFPSNPKHDRDAAGNELRAELSRSKSFLVRRYGAGGRLAPGALTPGGHRIPPHPQDRRLYETVDWLRGGVMAFRRDVLTAECFSADVFALYAARCGRGEDTILSRRVASKGELVFAFCAQVSHPGLDHPRACAIEDLRRGYATAFSRRLINDNYRGLDPALLEDRLGLLKSYLGTAAIEWVRSLRSFQPGSFKYALGYSLGALRGLARKPVAEHLSPRVDWWLDAERALIRAEKWGPVTTASV